MNTSTTQEPGQNITLADLYDFLSSDVSKEKMVIAEGIDRSAYYRDRKKVLTKIEAGRLKVYVKVFNENSQEQLSLESLLNGATPEFQSVASKYGLG